MVARDRVSTLAVLFALGWIGVIGSRYVITILKALQHPFNPGDDVNLALAWLGGAVVIIVSLAVSQRIAFAIWCLAIIGTILGMLLLSHTAIEGLIALWVLAIAALIGDSFLSALHVTSKPSFGGRLVIDVALGVMAFSLVMLVLAATRQLTVRNVWAVLIVSTILGLRRGVQLVDSWRRGGTSLRLPALDIEFKVLLILSAFVFTINLSWAVAPETRYDALNYHLAVPRIYLEQHGLVDLYFFHSYFAHLVEMFFAFCMALHGQIVAKFANALIGLLTTFGVYSLGAMIFTPGVGAWAAAFFGTVPLTCWLTGTAHSDLTLALFILAATLSLLNWNRTDKISWIMVTGILAGSAVAVKLNAMYAAIGIGLALCGLLLMNPEPTAMRTRTLAVLAFSAALIAMPWFVMAYVHTGNPIFPLLNGLFKSPKWDISNTLMNASDFGMGKGFSQLLRLPFRMTFDSTRFGEGLPRGALGPLLLLFVPFGLILLVKKNSEARIVGVIAAVYLLLWAQTFQYGRYYIVILPLVALLGIAGLNLLARTAFAAAVVRIALLILLVFQVAILPVLFWNIPERFPLALAFGFESPESFLTRALGGYGGVVHINETVPYSHKVLGLGTESLRYYLKPPLESLSESSLDSPVRRISDIPPGPELARTLSDLKFSFLLVSRDVLTKPESYYPYAFKQFLEKFAVREYSDEAIAVYRFKPVPIVN
jgi:4-amino-4-deoxy-L-arabinose transferase-like glycosyltransferase